MKRFKKNERYTLKIEDMTDLGFGVGHIDGAAVFVSDTVIGDTVEVQLIKVNSSYLVGRAVSFLERGSMRCESRCSERGCRACAYRNISYNDECSLKEEGVRRLFSRPTLGVATELITPSPRALRYRNKAQYPVYFKDGEYGVGFFAPKSHRVTPVADCPLTPEVFSRITADLASFFKKHKLSVYNEEAREGLLRHVYLRRAEVSGEILLTLVVTSFDFPCSGELVGTLTAKYPEIVGILLNKNAECTNVVLGKEYKTLFGEPYMYDTLAGVKLKLTAPSFYQVNHSACELLYKKAKELAAPEKSDTLLDLYCGVGSIGLSMADLAGEVIGIEIVESAVLCAGENAKANGIENAHFYTGDAKGTEGLLSVAERELGRKISPDIIILDPPRAGCAEELIHFTSRLAPKRIVYISCNPKTLARDLETYKSLGYEADAVYPFDLFPMTGHVESVVCLTRQSDVI